MSLYLQRKICLVAFGLELYCLCRLFPLLLFSNNYTITGNCRLFLFSCFYRHDLIVKYFLGIFILLFKMGFPTVMVEKAA